MPQPKGHAQCSVFGYADSATRVCNTRLQHTEQQGYDLKILQQLLQPQAVYEEDESGRAGRGRGLEADGRRSDLPSVVFMEVGLLTEADQAAADGLDVTAP